MTTTTTTITTDPHPLLTRLRRDGFVILSSLLSPEELASLRGAAARLTTTARTGAWPHVRTVGKQFPPWDASLVARGEAGIWGVQHLLHPDLPCAREDRDEFVRLYFHPRLLAVAGELLQVSDGNVNGDGHGDGDDDGDDRSGGMMMELLNMLVRPSGPGAEKPFALRWHRDDIPPTATPEEELARLKTESGRQAYVHTQWNLPLFDDDSLIVVPGSHARARTEAERNADPYEDNMPGQVVVRLKAGDCVFYDNNILHRGVYYGERERMTLHGSVGHAKGSKERARNVLQHGVGEWVDRCDFSVLGDGKERRTAEGLRKRLVELGRENQGKDVGYSLEG
ncbi:hypothetical protein N657DRAFT_640715 [Parathielavia appendiculata]|uniref:Phytanoyl-CoA dioxygenase n=1 Tax=Parathielavia appendiculata TaxID=2587402 RepID=A0AAN6U641_9PEZI|nr:hypothetical protein N657DRAFT_640715 [Parathielavia appendiculata]